MTDEAPTPATEPDIDTGKDEPDVGWRRLLSRRNVLRGAGAVAAATFGVSAARTIASCAGSGGRGRIEVVVVWAGDELDRFREVVKDYRPAEVEVTSAGDDIDALLRARRRANNSPDVAIISRPGIIQGYYRQGWISPMRAGIAQNYPERWNDLLRFDDGEPYGVWLKAAHKSLFWHLSRTLDYQPATWQEFVEQVRGMAADGSQRAPLAIGAADGWVLTDWFENLLAAHADRELYQALAWDGDSWGDPAVVEALTQLAELWAVPGAFPGGRQRALLTQFDQSAIQLATEQANLFYGADFARPVLRRFVDDVDELQSFRFPESNGRRPLVVGGDAAVVFDNSAGGHRLVGWLAGVEAFRSWVRAGGYLSPNVDIDLGDYEELQTFAEDIRNPGDGFHFDLTDLLPAGVNGQDGQGSWAILQDFFATVTADGADLDHAVGQTVDRMAAAVRQARQAEDEVAL